MLKEFLIEVATSLAQVIGGVFNRAEMTIFPTTHVRVPMPRVKPTKGKKPRGKPGIPAMFTDSEIAGALDYARNNQNHAAALLGCHVSTVRRYVIRKNAVGSFRLGAPIRFTDAAIAAALVRTNGDRHAAADLLNCSRETIDRYRARHKEPK